MEHDVMNKILEVFYEFPDENFTVRKLAKLAKIPKATIHKYLSFLKKQKLITQENQPENTLLFKIKKTNYFTEKIVSSGLLEELIVNLNPSCIILFGSIRKAESVKESDIDLFVESSVRKEIDLSKFEKKLKHKIQLFVKSDIRKLNIELLNNVLNGIKLYGSFKLK